MVYNSADFLNMPLKNLMQVDPSLAELTIGPEDLSGLDFSAEDLIGTIVSRVLARNKPPKNMRIGTFDIYNRADIEV